MVAVVVGRDPVRVEGLDAFRKALKALGDGAAGKQLRLALNEASAFIIDRTRPLMPSLTGRARRSLKARSSQNTVRVAYGGKVAPYVPWLDYGGRVGPARSVHRPFVREGRYLYPTLGKHRAEFERLLDDALADVARSVGIEVD